MIQRVLLTFLIVGSMCVLTHADPSPEPIRERHEPDQYYQDENQNGERLLDAKGHLAEEENRIVQDVFSPDYYEPSIVLDYRYLKTGGREYARGDGGQVLILPRRKHGPPVMHNNYDELLEHLRKKRLAELNKLLQGNSPHRVNNGFEIRPEYTEVIQGDRGYED